MELKLLEELQKESQPVNFNLTSGIYFLFQDDELVYVGQAACRDIRLLTHISEGLKKFNRFAWIPCEPENLEYLEAQYILKFLPKYNKTLPHTLGYLFPETLKRHFGISMRCIRKVIEKHQPQNIRGRYQIDEIRELLQRENLV